jgi:hypothetical protein
LHPGKVNSYQLEDWTAPLAELRRVPTADGRLIAAVELPVAITLTHVQQGRTPSY